MTTLAPVFLIQSASFLLVTSLVEFKFQPDTTNNSRVICPCESEKLLYNVVNTLAPSFFIGFSSFLQVTRITIKSQTSSKFDQI